MGNEYLRKASFSLCLEVWKPNRYERKVSHWFRRLQRLSCSS
jgi:hypothetical protein